MYIYWEDYEEKNDGGVKLHDEGDDDGHIMKFLVRGGVLRVCNLIFSKVKLF